MVPPKSRPAEPLAGFHPAVREWFAQSFAAPTRAQVEAWPAVARGDHTLLLAPTGSGKTLAAFLWCLNRLMVEPVPDARRRCRVLYVSPLKALAVDVERNLRTPITGITSVAAARGERVVVPVVAVRTGDTPASERARFQREPADILITTPESLYLLLTSNAREALRSIDTVIVDEIHALVPTKRGAHLALSLERLEALTARPFQRVGLSATQRPLEEVARFLGGTAAEVAMPGASSTASGPAASVRRATRGSRGAATRAGIRSAALDPAARVHAEFAEPGEIQYRPVTIVDAGSRKPLDLRIEVPVEDMAKLGQPEGGANGTALQDREQPSIWTAMYPRLLELVRAHRSTLLFVNSRRTAEKLAAELNELAGEPLVRAHHGSLAREQRSEVEDLLKRGDLRALAATSSLELGIDMGAIDLVVQVEAPPSVASGLQRIGRGGHQVDAVSRGVIFPKFRGDLVACAAVTRAMRDGHVEATRYPRNPLDVLAQQIVAMTAMDRWAVDDLFATVRRAAPFAGLGREIFDGVLDMLSGRYPSDEFAELRPRVTWDRVRRTVVAREHAKRVAVVNAGTIPDRGLYGVFLAGAERGAARVGELDEEMVFESRVGETFLLGASTWRIEEIGHDRVVVSPAPGEPGRMPFWKGEAAGRPLEFGRAIGALVRALDAMPASAAIDRLVRDHDLDAQAAANLVAYLRDQKVATAALPDDRTIVIERCRDELGDWRVCLLSPLGGQVLAPWAMAAAARVREALDVEVETMWTNDGFVVRFPDTDEPPDAGLLVPSPDDVEALVLRQLGSTALLAAKFRECAGRALLLPRRRPGQRTPLWQQRKRAADLLAVASKYASFPMLLEAYRECLRDVFDMPALTSTLRDISTRTVRVVTVDSATPSPFAASLLFGYVANYIYDGDAPLAERRAQALAIDQAQLRELLGDASLRELLAGDAMDEVERELQHLDPRYRVKSPDGLHDLLLRLGDLSIEEIEARTGGEGGTWAARLVGEQRAIGLTICGTSRLVAVEDAVRYRDALDVPLPPGLPEALLEPVRDPQGDLALRYARTHGPFTVPDLAARTGLGRACVESVLHRLAATGRLVEGEFRPAGTYREWCDANVLATIRRRSLARLRRQVEPVEAHVFARLIVSWQGVTRRRPGLDALLDAIEHLQGAPLAASLIETQILPARVEDYAPGDLDMLLAAGEVVWIGIEPLGDRDGRVALYLAEHLPRLWRAPQPGGEWSPREQAVFQWLRSQGASFFAPLHEAAGGGYPGETIAALWSLVWRGLVTNDAFHALRAFLRPSARDRQTPSTGRVFRSRRTAPPSGEGRWSLVSTRVPHPASDTEWSAAVVQQWLSRYGIVSRQIAGLEGVAGGFSAVYAVLRTLEERGRIRRGYFASGVGAMQFALPPALELLRSLRAEPETAEVVVIAATDPANPYGALLAWPSPDTGNGTTARGPTRTVGSTVVLVNGRLGAYVGRHGRPLLSYLPDVEPDHTIVGRGVASALADLARLGERRHGGLLVAEINGEPAATHPLAEFLPGAGFAKAALGYQVRRPHLDRGAGRSAGPDPESGFNGVGV